MQNPEITLQIDYRKVSAVTAITRHSKKLHQFWDH